MADTVPFPGSLAFCQSCDYWQSINDWDGSCRCPIGAPCPAVSGPDRVISGTSHRDDSAMPDYDDPIYQG